MFEPAKEGARAGKVLEPFDKALDEYYRVRGWGENGVPTEETLRKLGLEGFWSQGVSCAPPALKLVLR